MMKKLFIAAGLTLTLAAPAFADTHIGAGVAGSGGTGPNRAEPPNTGVQPQGDTAVRRPEGSEPISGDLKGRDAAAGEERSRGEPAPSARGRETHPSAPTGRGASGNSGAGGSGRGGAGEASRY